jgi:hypothetical protein
MLAPSVTLAQTSSTGPAASDLAQQAKLRAHTGTWTCVSDPPAAKPVTFTETEQGNWFVAHRTGVEPATSYERWSRVLKEYILIAIFDSGASDVEETPSLDPDNATWTPVFPPHDNQGRNRFPVAVSRAGDVLHSTSSFYDDSGNVRTAMTTCTKQ